MRLFVAIDLPYDVRKHLSQWLPPHSGLKHTQPEQLHLTLLFLGECTQEQASLIKIRLQNIHFESFQITVRNIGAFPDKKNPQVFWAGVEKSKELMVLHTRVKEALLMFKDSGIAHGFKPHITLARAAKGYEYKETERFYKKMGEITVPVYSFCLKKSVLSQKGSRHSVLKTYYADNENPMAD
jgi:2'-5' RNA ligase